MRNLDLRSIGYAFIANETNVYFPDGDEKFIVIERLVCKKCGARWHTSMMECFFCGEMNYYLYQCVACKKFYSITDSQPRCGCGSENAKLIKACVNKNCPTNTDDKISEIARKYKGVFDLKSSLKLSLMYCLKCGSPHNFYKTAKVFVFNSQKYASYNDYLKEIESDVFANDIILLKKRENDRIVYDFLKHNGKPRDEPQIYRFPSIAEVIEKIFEQI
ncbi:MAG: hypothetical protein RMM16_04725 [Chloroherpetonaceae bacterium]|nr:hypothetical protein [Chloroherpetonaceae bacterium]